MTLNSLKIAGITFLILLVSMSCARGQTFNEWFRQKKTQRRYLRQQIVALKVYLKHLKDGYAIVQKGMTLVGDIKEGNFNSHKEYFTSLKNVNRVVSSSPKVSRIAYLQSVTVSLVNRLRQELDDPFLSESERNYLRQVCSNILALSEDNIDVLNNILTDGELEMKDNERLNRLNVLYVEVLNCFSFTKTLCNDTRLLILQREAEKRDVDTELHINSNK